MAYKRLSCILFAVALVAGARAAGEDHDDHEHEIEITWEANFTACESGNNTYHVEVNETIAFKAGAGGTNSVFEFVDKTHYDTCNFDGADPLQVQISDAFEKDFTPDDVFTGDEVVKWHYFGDDFSSNCESGTKVAVKVYKKGGLPGHEHCHGDHDDHNDTKTTKNSASQVSSLGIFGVLLAGVVSAFVMLI